MATEHFDDTRDTMSDRELLLRIDERLYNVIRKMDDHEGRIRHLEGFRWLLVGGMLTVSSVVTWVVQALPWGFLQRNK